MDLAQRLSKLSPEQRKLFEAKLKQQGIDLTHLFPQEITREREEEDLSFSSPKKKDDSSSPIQPIEKKEYYPLSASQERMYILNNFIEYNMRLAYQLEGNLDRERIDRVFQKLVQRQESFRTSFELKEGRPIQRVHDRVEFEVEYNELPGDINDAEVQTVVTRFYRGFDLSVPPLLRVGLVKLTRGRYLFLVNMNHIISDGVSMGILTREFARLYRGEKLPMMKIRYRDFSQWHNRWSETAEYKKKENYWLELLSGELPVLEMPTDYPRPSVQRFEGERVHFAIAGEAYQALKNLALKQDASLYMVLLAVYYTLLYRYTGQEDIIIGSITAGRERWELENLIGVFINAIALRNYPAAAKTFAEFLKEIKQNTLTAFENQSYPFGNLLEKVITRKNLSRNPLFDVMLIFQSVDMRSRRELEGLQVSLDRYRYETRYHSQQDITLWAAVQGDRIRMDLEYCTALFKPETMERFARHFLTLLQEVTAHPELQLPAIGILSEKEKSQILEQFNKTGIDYTAGQTIPRLFAEQAQRTPDHVALLGLSYRSYRSDSSDLSYISIAYKELNERSQQLAALLVERGVKPDTIVAIRLEPSIEMIIGLFGILKAGGAYLPINPEYPEERSRFMLADSGAKWLVTTGTQVEGEKVGRWEGTVVKIAEGVYIRPKDANALNTQHLTLNTNKSLAYIIYTSGSTGKPKGVMVEHYNLSAYVKAFEQEFNLLPTDTVIQQASYSFDAFGEEVYPILLKGGRIAVPGPGVVKDTALLMEFIRKQGVTVIDCSPLLLAQLNQLGQESPIRLYISGGDVLKGEYIGNLVKKGIVYNTYGPTETTICASYYKCTGDVRQGVPIGKPISDYRIYIMNPQRCLMPIGIPGELCVGGVGVSRGYLNRPDLTTEKFISIFFKEDYRSKRSYKSNRPYITYKTGDLARWRWDGNIEFLGRIDQQVKIRGYRIELQEIENQLMSHTEIKEAVVLDKEDENENKYLCAYLVTRKGEKSREFTFTVSGLRKYLAEKLPDYMIPAHFIEIEKIPLTPNGKVDGKALDKYSLEGQIETGAQYAPPTNEIESQLSAIWSEVLKKSRIGIQDNFFDLGGQSILAMKTTARIQEVFGVKIPLMDFFQVGTIQGIAAIISGSRRETAANLRDGAVRRKGFIQPFELRKPPLLRVAVVKLKDRRHFFFADMHHIITDGFSADIIANEFAALYTGNELNELPIQYKDFSQWQKNFYAGERFRKQEQYWLNLYKGEIPRLNLPLDNPRQAGRKAEGKRVQMEVEKELISQLKRVAMEKEVTLFMILLAVYAIVLAKTTAQEDIIVGTPVSGRTHAKLTQLIGMFVNTLALRIQPRKHLTIDEFLQEIKAQTLAALENQDYPFERLVEKLNLSGEAGRNPVFDTLFTLENVHTPGQDMKTGNLTFIPYQLEYGNTMFDLILGVTNTENSARVVITYNLRLFHEETIRQMARDFMAVLTWVLHEPGRRLKEVDMSVSYPVKGAGKDPSPGINVELQTPVNRYSDDLVPVEISTSQGSLTRQQKEWILNEFNNSRMEYPGEITIHRLYERQAGETPFRTAVVCEARQLSYRELSKKSNRVAQWLKEKGLRSDGCVGLMAGPSLEAMIGILGILKAGGCYLPLNPEYPREQIRFLLTDASITMVLTHRQFMSPPSERAAGSLLVMDRKSVLKKQSFPRYPGDSGDPRRSDKSAERWSEGPSLVGVADPVLEKEVEHVYPLEGLEKEEQNPAGTLNFPEAVKSGQLAYMIYTSGSTGRPKGVVVDHRAVVNRLTWMQKKYPLTEADVFLQKTVFVFDVSVIELFSWFMGGARLCFLGSRAETDLYRILDSIARNHITALSFTPTILHTFFLSIGKENIRKLATLKWIFCAGEQLPKGLEEKWKSLPVEAKLENLYGPTEAAVYASYYSCTREPHEGPVPIGKPLGNTRLYVLNRQGELLPPGEVGELVLAGGGLARGYLNRPELTADKFVPDPYYPGDRMYLTGDYAKLLPEGNMVYLGRMDTQVKIKGIRIELGEIEAVLLKHPGIREAAVIARDNQDGVKSLAAYIVTRKHIGLKDLREYLSGKVPQFMVPSLFYKVEQMPMTPSGKLDRKRLPGSGEAMGIDVQYTAPRTELEHELEQAWAEIFPTDQIGIDHNFFEMGGDSLKGNLLLARLNERYGTELIVKDLFEAPTIRQLAGIFLGSQTKKYPTIRPLEKKEYYPATSAQKRLYIIHQLDPENTAYNVSVGMIIEGSLDKDRLKSTVKQLVRRHESLRTGFEMREGEIIQKIEEDTGFEAEFFEGNGSGWEDADIKKMISGEISPVNISPEVKDNLLSGVKVTKKARIAREI